MTSRKTIITFILAFVAASSLRAQEVVADPGAITQRSIQFSERLENWFSEMATWEQQLHTMLESKEWLQKTYAAAQFLGGSQQTMDLLNEIGNYKALVEAVSTDIENYSRNGLMSFSQLRYSTSLLTQGLKYVSGTLSENMKEALLSNGMTVAERFSLLCGTNEKLKKEYWKLMLLSKQNKTRAAAAARSMSAYNASLLLGLSPAEPEKLNIDDDGFNAVYNDAVVAKICDGMTQKQNRYYKGGNIVETASSEGRGHRNNAIAIASYFIGIAAALLLAIAFERRNKGDQQSHDALYKIGIGLLFAVIALQVVTKYFSF